MTAPPANGSIPSSVPKHPASSRSGLKYPSSARNLFAANDPAVLMAIMNSSSSSDDDSSSSKHRKHFIGTTRGLSWAEELEAYLEGKYTPIQGDNGAALQKQKANIRQHIVGGRKREIKSWFTNPDDDEIPLRHDDGTEDTYSLNSLDVHDILKAIGQYFDDDTEGEDAQHYFFKVLKLKKGEKAVDLNSRVLEALRECPDIDDDSIQVRSRYTELWAKDRDEPISIHNQCQLAMRTSSGDTLEKLMQIAADTWKAKPKATSSSKGKSTTAALPDADTLQHTAAAADTVNAALLDQITKLTLEMGKLSSAVNSFMKSSQQEGKELREKMHEISEGKAQDEAQQPPTPATPSPDAAQQQYHTPPSPATTLPSHVVTSVIPYRSS